MKNVLIIAGLVTTIGMSFALYSKTHKIRECKVIQNYDKYITVEHPNGNYYDFFTYNSNEYKKDSIIKVSFNELKLDEHHYEINSANPNN